jgi:quercetin dioxygenase-like cupin family protein
MKNKPITVSEQEGENLSVVGDTYRILITGKETDGEFATMEFNVPPDGGPGPHSHADFHESFYVVEGEVEVKSEAGSYTAKKGSFVLIPKGGIVHHFKNKTSQNAVLLCTVVPSGLETFFEEIGKPVTYGEFLPTPHMDEASAKKLGAIAEKHGQKVYPPDFFGQQHVHLIKSL